MHYCARNVSCFQITVAKDFKFWEADPGDYFYNLKYKHVNKTSGEENFDQPKINNESFIENLSKHQLIW